MIRLQPKTVRAGQRRRAPGAEPYVVLAVRGDAVLVRGDSGWTAGPWLRTQVLRDEYLGRSGK